MIYLARIDEQGSSEVHGQLLPWNAYCQGCRMCFYPFITARQERRAQQERNAGCARTASLWKTFVLIVIFGRPLPKVTTSWKGLARKIVPGWGRSIFTSPPRTFTGH